jgi:hypothetical protein
MWILDHPRDLAADFRAFYHLGWAEALALPGPEFLALAYRVAVFPGVMAARIAEQEKAERRNVPAGARLVASDRLSILADPLLRDVVDMG